ncbi:MAG: hypothetical protein ACLSAF_16960 [Intestinimonas sp.]
MLKMMVGIPTTILANHGVMTIPGEERIGLLQSGQYSSMVESGYRELRHGIQGGRECRRPHIDHHRRLVRIGKD